MTTHGASVGVCMFDQEEYIGLSGECGVSAASDPSRHLARLQAKQAARCWWHGRGNLFTVVCSAVCLLTLRESVFMHAWACLHHLQIGTGFKDEDLEQHHTFLKVKVFDYYTKMLLMHGCWPILQSAHMSLLTNISNLVFMCIFAGSCVNLFQCSQLIWCQLINCYLIYISRGFFPEQQ